MDAVAPQPARSLYFINAPMDYACIGGLSIALYAALHGAAEVLEAAKEMGLLVGKSGLEGNVIRMTPPLVITPEDVDYALDVLDRALAASK